MEQIKLNQARAKHNRKETIIVCPSNISPNNVWGCCLETTGEYMKNDFNETEFWYYNCNEEMGDKISYYLK